VAAAARAHAAHAERLHAVDWLRMTAIAGVFVVHVLQPFDPWDEWHVTNAVRTPLAGEVVLFMAPWIMPLLMLLAGVSAWHSLQHRTNRAYLGERVARLLLPLAVGMLVLVPPQVYAERRLQGQFGGSFLAFYPHFFEGIYPRGNLSWHHLWFLAHLFLYSLVALPLFRYWHTEKGSEQLRWLARRCSGKMGLVWLALPLVLERHLLWALFPERHMLASDWSNHAILLVAYVYGYVLAGAPELAQAIDRTWPRALAAAAAGSAMLAVLGWMGVFPSRLPEPYSLGYLAFWTLYALVAWAWMIALLGVARRYLNRSSPMLEQANRSGFAWYLVHQTVIVVLAAWIVPWKTGALSKFAVLALLSLAGTVAAAELLLRLPVTRWIFGMTASPARAAMRRGSFQGR
jgi:peptidoglycan/LPS O-acetylase OafA/YrhL